MSRRARAVGFGAAAAVCAGIAAGATGGDPGGVEARYGELREVVVVERPLARGERLDKGRVERTLAVRRVPERFVPPAALTSPAQALGRTAAVAIPAGSYVLDSHLAVPGADRPRGRRLPTGQRPVEIAVTGAGALASGGGTGSARRVDVVVTTEPGPGGGAGRTYVAARAVALLDLRPAGRSGGPEGSLGGSGPGAWVATLALRRSQALELIQAESFARAIRLIRR